MNLKIPADEAIQIIKQRYSEIDSFNFNTKAWKDRTENDLREIFPLGSMQWLQVSQIQFDTFVTSEKAIVLSNGKDIGFIIKFPSKIKLSLDLATKLLVRISKYREKHINVVGKIPIYLDVDRYLHIHMRRVDEMKINNQFAHKSNFQWNEEDVLMVIGKVIEKINIEIQDFFEKNPGKRYSRFGRKSVYFEGDYYTLHIESNGAISTFHRTWKEHEQREKRDEQPN